MSFKSNESSSLYSDVAIDKPALIATHIENTIIQNQGNLYFPNETNPLFLLQLLGDKNFTLKHFGLPFTFNTDKENVVCKRLDTQISGSFKTSLTEQSVFIPDTLNLPENITVALIHRGFSAHPELHPTEESLLAQFDLLHSEETSLIPETTYLACLAGKISASDYLDLFQKSFGLQYNNRVVKSLIARIESFQRLFPQGKPVYRYLFNRQQDFSPKEIALLSQIKHGHDQANFKFKQQPFGSLSFKEYVQAGLNYVEDTAAYTKIRTTEIINAVTQRLIDIQNNPSLGNSLAFSVSTLFLFSTQEIQFLFQHLPITVKSMSVENEALKSAYPDLKEGKPIYSPLVEARLKHLLKQTDRQGLEVLLAQEAAFQVFRKNVQDSKLISQFPNTEKNFLARERASQLSLKDCQTIYQDFVKSGQTLATENMSFFK